MKIRDPGLWATIVDANPLPAGCSADPRTWGVWYLTAPAEARSELPGAIVVIVAHRWADAMERALEAGTPREALAAIALATLREIAQELGCFAPNDFHVGCALTMLEQTWEHGEALRAALEVQLLESLMVPTAPRLERRHAR
jgi:hypothetical protein